jgi:hypothetical protein
MRLISILAAIAVLSAGGCQYSASVSGSSAELNEEAEAVYDDLLAGDDAAIVARMSSDNDPAQISQQLPMLRDMVGFDRAPDPMVLSSTQQTSSAGRIYVVEQSYSHPDRIVVMRTQFLREGEDWRIQGLNLNVEMTGSGMGPGSVQIEGDTQN